jgi:prepilin-type N-terminal cleavage/methylation domain-containing protein
MHRDQTGFTAFELVITIFLLGILMVAVYFAYINSPYSKPASKPAQSSQNAGGSGPPCDFTNNDVGCGLKSFAVTSPSAGQQVCVGDKLDIRWTAPSDMEGVTITVREASLSGTDYKLGTFAASDKQYEWLVNNVPPGDAYKVWVNSRYKAASVNGHSDGLFTVKNCSASPSPSTKL